LPNARLASRAQADAFPRLRKLQGEFYDKKLWENDIDVSVSGPRNTTIRFVGGLFAANSNIKAFAETANDTIRALRFARVEFQWYRGSDVTYYTYTPLKDTTLATIEGNDWEQVWDGR
jgi:hypothetical protein